MVQYTCTFNRRWLITKAALTLGVAERTLVWSSYNQEVAEQKVEDVVDSNHQEAEVEVQVRQLLEEAHVRVVRANVEGIPAIKVSK